jgi:hypothetical protein
LNNILESKLYKSNSPTQSENNNAKENSISLNDINGGNLYNYNYDRRLGVGDPVDDDS